MKRKFDPYRILFWLCLINLALAFLLKAAGGDVHYKEICAWAMASYAFMEARMKGGMQ